MEGTASTQPRQGKHTAATPKPSPKAAAGKHTSTKKAIATAKASESVQNIDSNLEREFEEALEKLANSQDPVHKKAKKKLNEATGNKLSAEQYKTLAAEYTQAEAKAWEEVAKVGTYADYFKERKANVEALDALLRAQAGLGALYEYDQYKSVKAMPNRPDLPPIYKYHLWPSYRVKKGTVPWNDYRSIRDAWKQADQLMITTGNRE